MTKNERHCNAISKRNANISQKRNPNIMKNMSL